MDPKTSRLTGDSGPGTGVPPCTDGRVLSPLLSVIYLELRHQGLRGRCGDDEHLPPPFGRGQGFWPSGSAWVAAYRNRSAEHPLRHNFLAACIFLGYPVLSAQRQVVASDPGSFPVRDGQ